jgi:hypothetical protein
MSGEGGSMAFLKTGKSLPSSGYKPLSAEQRSAIELLLQGKSDREVAEAIGVARETAWQWRNVHPIFIAELNRRRKELWLDAQERLRALVGKAIEVLEKVVESGDVKTSVEVLKVAKLYGQASPPSGPEDPELVLWQQAERWAADEYRREGPAEDPTLALLLRDQKISDLTRQRMAKLQEQWVSE